MSAAARRFETARGARQKNDIADDERQKCEWPGISRPMEPVGEVDKSLFYGEVNNRV
jgi:hypothetical protein